MSQLFTPHRNCSTNDLLNNVIGTALGIAAAIAFENTIGAVRFLDHGNPDPSALALLFCQAAALTFPMFPVVQLPVWREKTLAFIHGPILNPMAFASAAFCWLALAMVLRAAKLRHQNVWLAVSVLLIPAQIGIVTRQPIPAELAGALAGIAVYRLRPFNPACCFLTLLMIRGLAPFHLTAASSQPFNWIPFGGFLEMDWQQGVQILLEKLFYYGTALWLLRRAGVRWIVSIAIVCTTLAAIEAIQTHIPGRTAEITDPLLALMAGIALHTLRRSPIGYHANS
jgi:VanZ family protein